MTQDQAIEEITRRLVDYYHPERIYLFGSATRGDGGPDSDLDFCVVLPDDARLASTGQVCIALYGMWARLRMWSGGRQATSTRAPPT